MMSDMNEEQGTELLQARQSPGLILRKAREEAKLTQAEVAQQLYLTVDLIQAIEADNYSKTPAVTFVRGYLRAYARLLNLPTEEIIQAFDAFGLSDKPAQFSTTRIYGERSRALEQYLPWASAIVILGIVITLFSLWMVEHGKSVTKLLHQTPTESGVAQSMVNVPKNTEDLTTSKNNTAAAPAEEENLPGPAVLNAKMNSSFKTPAPKSVQDQNKRTLNEFP